MVNQVLTTDPVVICITFNIPEDPIFKRKGNDLYKQIDIDLYTAILGGEIMIETLTGKVKFPVPAYTQQDTTVRLRGKGFPLYKKTISLAIYMLHLK